MAKLKSFMVLNKALGTVSPQAFTVLYYICNNLNLNNTTRAEFDRYDIARRLGLIYDGIRSTKKQLDKITKWIEELEEKGFVKRDVIFDKSTGKRTLFCAITEQFITSFEHTSVPKNDERVPKTGVTIKHIKQESIESKQSTENSQRKQKVPDEESLAEYRRRMRLELAEDEENDDAEEVHLYEAPAPYHNAEGLPF